MVTFLVASSIISPKRSAIGFKNIPHINEDECISFVISKRNTVENDVQYTESSEEMFSCYLPIQKSYYFNENDDDD